MIMHVSSQKSCSLEHERVKNAAKDLEELHREKEHIDREARHKARNVRMLMQAVLARLERRNDD